MLKIFLYKFIFIYFFFLLLFTCRNNFCFSSQVTKKRNKIKIRNSNERKAQRNGVSDKIK